MTKKYEMFGDESEHGLQRIRALKDFGPVVTGDIGGWIEKESNLSHNGDCWVSGNAQVSEDAEVSGNAWVDGYAKVSGDVNISGDARISGHTRVDGRWIC